MAHNVPICNSMYFFSFIFLLVRSVCLCVCVRAYKDPQRTEQALVDHLELELQAAMSHSMGVRRFLNRTLFFCKSSKLKQDSFYVCCGLLNPRPCGHPANTVPYDTSLAIFNFENMTTYMSKNISLGFSPFPFVYLSLI